MRTDKKGLTWEQKLFLSGKRELEKYTLIAEQRELTQLEKEASDQIKITLLESIMPFGMKEAKRRMKTYYIDPDAYMDVQQAIALKFFEVLPKYDPLISTPTTFFVSYINEVISDYLFKYSQHLSQYDAHNLTKVRGAIQYFEAKGVAWDEAMIATKTGLSIKVVKNTLYIGENSMRTTIDDAGNIRTTQPTPEEHYLQYEETMTIIKVLNEVLSTDDLNFFLMRMNLGGEKELTYKEMAAKTNSSVRDIKQRLSAIIARLASSRALQEYKRQKPNECDAIFHLRNTAEIFLEENITRYKKHPEHNS